MAKQPTKHLNNEGTHVHLSHPDVDDSSWWCPVDVADTYVDVRGWVYSPPRDTSLDGLFDVSTAEGDLQTGFDPAEHTVDAVNEHLAKHVHAAPGEVERVLELERAGKNRVTVLDPREPVEDDNNGDD